MPKIGNNGPGGEFFKKMARIGNNGPGSKENGEWWKFAIMGQVANVFMENYENWQYARWQMFFYEKNYQKLAIGKKWGKIVKIGKKNMQNDNFDSGKTFYGKWQFWQCSVVRSLSACLSVCLLYSIINCNRVAVTKQL